MDLEQVLGLQHGETDESIDQTHLRLFINPVDQASERQRADGMCWQQPGELYNGSQAFKATARDRSGIIVTLVADNYFGYCIKEVKTQISYSANLYGLAEEERSGGALAFIIKRNYKPWWEDNWRQHLSVDIVNGEQGHELKLDGHKLVASYLRVGLHESDAWRIFKVRQGFIPTV